MKWLIYKIMLKPLILRNYRMRRAGLLPDEWYWADRKALDWGYATDFNGKDI